MHEMLMKMLLAEGASMVGFADLSGLPAAPRESFDSAVWIGVALDPNIVKEMVRGPTKLYEIEYRKKNDLLKRLGRMASDYLQRNGFRTVQRLATDEGVDMETLSTPLPHKTVATRAGVGWIGKCGLLVTREFGSAIRMAVVLTDAYLEGETPIGVSHCGDCEECVIHCPAGAVKGPDWAKGMDREEFYDAHVCQERIRDYQAERGLGAEICGICIAVCPFTKEYVDRALGR